jgi:tRNA A58 N-methylase Trm61
MTIVTKRRVSRAMMILSKGISAGVLANVLLNTVGATGVIMLFVSAMLYAFRPFD